MWRQNALLLVIVGAWQWLAKERCGSRNRCSYKLKIALLSSSTVASQSIHQFACSIKITGVVFTSFSSRRCDGLIAPFFTAKLGMRTTTARFTVGAVVNPMADQ